MFVPPDGDGHTTITGLAVDGYGRLIACDYDGGQLFVYDLAGRSLVARRELPAEEAWPNDVAVAGDSAYVTDTRHPLVWRLPAPVPPPTRSAVRCMQISPFGVASDSYLGDQAAEHIRRDCARSS
jgi:sugar lactone lactonase YvrE